MTVKSWQRVAWIVAAIGLASGVSWGLTGARPADAAATAGDEVRPAEDNPPGCTTATREDTPQCGAQGRDHFGNATHVPPITACEGRRSPAGSLLTRRIPDGPRHDDGTLAFISGVCVYLPPGYDANGLRYPVLYLLHGGGGDEADWATFGGVQKILDDSYARDPANAVIAVFPDGRSGFWYDSYDRSLQNETYVLDHVLPYIDRHFRTIGDRRGRAVIGLSNGGYGAMHLAAKAPDKFRAAGSMSGNLGGRSFPGLDSPAFAGAPKTASSYYEGNIPTRLVPNLDDVDLTIDWGATCSSDATVDACGTFAFEQTFRYDNQLFRDELQRLGHKGAFEYRETEGAHAWRWWSKWLRERQLLFVLQRLADPRPANLPVKASPIPPSFRYRSIAPSFKVYGYAVNVGRPAIEFLDLTDVTKSGFVIRGSGATTMTTASRYIARRRYLVTGATATAQQVTADRRGRLRIAVDLGPAHTYDQKSPQGQGAATDEAYFVARTVTIGPAHG